MSLMLICYSYTYPIAVVFIGDIMLTGTEQGIEEPFKERSREFKTRVLDTLLEYRVAVGVLKYLMVCTSRPCIFPPSSPEVFTSACFQDLGILLSCLTRWLVLYHSRTITAMKTGINQ
jgi:hypothetical protein